MKLVSIHKGWNLSQAQLVRSRLESAGFYAVLINEYTAMVFGGIFPVFVKVPEVEIAEAKEFLAAPAE
ncbi:MAG: DUF2007 domain-containing protein [Verrucomicrobiota bacterium]|jgi:hypothetical protein